MFEPNDILGWISSFLLVFTISFQLYRQSRCHQKAKISKLLYVGQFLANLGFVVYSFNLDNKVFIFTNSMLVILNAVGYFYTLKQEKRPTSH